VAPLSLRAGVARPQIVLVRHGETAWSREGRHTGRTDIPLTEEGRRKAAALAGLLRAWPFVRVLSSPLRRAVETCRLGLPHAHPELREELVEWDYGAYESRTTADIQTERPGWSLWTDGTPDGERAEDVGRRVDPLVAELRAAQGDVAIFAHGHVLRVLTARWLELSPVEGRRFALDTGSVGILGYEHETPVLLRWNEPHDVAEAAGPASASAPVRATSLPQETEDDETGADREPVGERPK
jgi:broad specificity phosphatase PhoE